VYVRHRVNARVHSFRHLFSPTQALTRDNPLYLSCLLPRRGGHVHGHDHVNEHHCLVRLQCVFLFSLSLARSHFVFSRSALAFAELLSAMSLCRRRSFLVPPSAILSPHLLPWTTLCSRSRYLSYNRLSARLPHLTSLRHYSAVYTPHRSSIR
jgi:hypothetical protein